MRSVAEKLEEMADAMKIFDCDPNHLSTAQVNRLLFDDIRDDHRCGDCIMVFGSLTAAKYRAPKAAELYQSERAPKVLFSGGTFVREMGVVEAIMMKEKAIALGIAEKDILTEEYSQNTVENVLASMLILHREYGLHKLNRLLIVTTFYHMKRCLLTLKTFMPKKIAFSLCPAVDPVTHPDNWWKNATGTQKVLAEARKLIISVKEGRLAEPG